MITGQVAIISTSGWVGRLVQLVTNSAWNHCVIAINEFECVSAEPGGAVLRYISDYRNDLVAWSQFDLSVEQRVRISTWGWEHLDTDYDYLGFAAIAVTKLLGPLAPKWLLRYIATRDRLICSYLVDLALQAGGIHLFNDHRPRGCVTPGSFGKKFKARGWSDVD